MNGICRECSWETAMRSFHGRSVRILKGQGHDACDGDWCDCDHGVRAEAVEIPEVSFYAEELQQTAGHVMPPAKGRGKGTTS